MKAKYSSPYYNPLKNYGEGIPMQSSAVSGPVKRYLEQQHQQPRQEQPRQPPSRGYQDTLEHYVGQQARPDSRSPALPTHGQKGNSYK